MWKIVFILCLLSIGLILYSTDVSGIQTGLWDVAGSPYIVVGDVQIPSGEELEIEAGVTVQFNGAYKIEALGMLSAEGTETDSIYFDRYPTFSGYWDEIRLEQETGVYELSYLYIRGADTGVNSIDAPLHLHHCHLDDNSKGVHLFAIGNPDPPEVLIEHCLIENSYENGIDIYENGNATIENCEIRGNGWTAQYRGAIQVNIQSNGCICSPEIRNNNIHHNHKQGITCTDMFSAGEINARIEENVIESNLTGVYFYNCAGKLISNQISDNFIPGDMNSGAGVMCYGSLSTPDISQNTITGNYTALYIVNNANPCLGDIESTDPDQQGLNTFMDNIDAGGNNNSVYVYNCVNTYTIKAENNTWDSEDFTEISETINDGNDNPSLPLVDFDPIYNEPQQVLSGNFTYTGSETIENWQLRLLSVNNTWDQEPYEIEFGSFELSGIPDGYYFLYIAGYNNEGNLANGAYGDWRFPEVLSMDESSQYTDLEIVVTDYDFQRYHYVPRVIEQGDLTLYHFIEGEFYPLNQALLYEDGDYLYFWGRPQYDESGWINEEFSQHMIYHKKDNLSVGDTWNAFRLWGGDETFIFEYSVIARDTLELNNQAVEVFTTQCDWNNGYCFQEQFAWETGISSILRLSEDNLLIKNYQADFENSQIPATLPSYLPLCEDYYMLYPTCEIPLSPWQLEFAYNEMDQIVLFWNPPGDSTNFQGYRIYANEVILDEIDISVRQYPLPENIEEDTDFYVTVYDEESESEPSNTITWIVPTEAEESNITQPEFLLHQNYPNPFTASGSCRGSTAISYSVASDSRIDLAVYNVKGQVVKKLISGDQKKGSYHIAWDGRTDSGSICSAGIYFYRLLTPQRCETRKLLLLR